jgi:hypothetical protein
MSKREAESRLGDVLLRMGTITNEQLADAVARQRAGDARALGVLLLDLGYAEARHIELALLRQQALRGHFSCEDGLRLLEEAREGTERVGSSLSDLAAAAEELRSKSS